METKDIADEDIYKACETIRKTYLHLDEEVMPLKKRLEHAKYYGRLRINLMILRKRSEMKAGKIPAEELPATEEMVIPT